MWGYLHAAYVVILSNTLGSLHSLMVVNFIPADSKSNCFEHYNRDCWKSLTRFSYPTSVVSFFFSLFFFINKREKAETTLVVEKWSIGVSSDGALLYEDKFWSVFPLLNYKKFKQVL